MCELMGLCFARPISADFSLREFALRGEENADGWGLGWYPDQSLALVKEPIQWRASSYTGFLECYPGLRSNLFIAHVRHKTTGGQPTHADTHPFTRELHGLAYCFCHNGTIDRFGELRLDRFRPVGATDSEHLFCYLLDNLAPFADGLDAPERWKWLRERLVEVNQRGKLNCLLSDGRRLFCYHDTAGYKGLTFRKVHIRSEEVRRFEDAEVQIDLEGSAANYGFVVATYPLSRTGWQRFEPGELLVFENGSMAYSSHRS